MFTQKFGSFSKRVSLISGLALLAAPSPGWTHASQDASDRHSKAPVILEDPKSQSVQPGQDAVFSVKATGESLNYKWFVNDVAQTGVNAKTVKIANVRTEFNGTKIYAVISNPYGASTSKEAILTVSKADPARPAITLFRAVPEVIQPGQKTRLEALYTNGQGVVTPGSLVLPSHHYIEISPSHTTTYNLTVTNASGQRITANVTVHVGNRSEESLESADSSPVEVIQLPAAPQPLQ